MDSWYKQTNYIWWQWHILILLFFPVTRVHCGFRLCPLYSWKSADFKYSAMMETNISVSGTLNMNIIYKSEGEIHCFWNWDYLTLLQREEIPTHCQNHNWPERPSARLPAPALHQELEHKAHDGRRVFKEFVSLGGMGRMDHPPLTTKTTRALVVLTTDLRKLDKH